MPSTKLPDFEKGMLIYMKTIPKHFDDLRVYTLNTYLKHTYGEKVYKIALHSNMTCPNRDGKLDTRGCIFCSNGGSGDFSVSGTLSEQIQKGKEKLSGKYHGNQFIAYFQSFTNTYAPISRLNALFSEALEHPDIVGLSIGTRADCLEEPVLELLSQLQVKHPNKFIWIELGLQTIHEQTTQYIRRHYPMSLFQDTINRLYAHHIPYIIHTIIGLPGETKEDFLETIHYVNSTQALGIKLQLLHVIDGTDMADDWKRGCFDTLDMDEYFEWLISAIEQLSPDICIHRLTGDGNEENLLAPLWTLQKRMVLNSFHKKMKEMNTWQGKNYYDSRTFNTI